MREVPNVPQGFFGYGGGYFFAGLTKYGIKDAIARAHPQFQLRLIESHHHSLGSTAGIERLIDGELSFALTRRSLEDAEYARAEARHFTLKQIPIALDGIAFVSHPDLSIPGLSIQQVQDIYLGKVKNWQELGGPDLPIVPMCLNPEMSTSVQVLFGELVDELPPTVKMVQDYTTAIRQVSSTLGAIYFGSAGLVKKQQTVRVIALAETGSQQYVQPFLPDGRVNITVLQDGTYPLTRRLFVVVRHDGTLDERAGIAYANLLLSGEGQEIIRQAGFVPLH
jgi:phosphate transport system substrate-binding protein